MSSAFFFDDASYFFCKTFADFFFSRIANEVLTLEIDDIYFVKILGIGRQIQAAVGQLAH